MRLLPRHSRNDKVSSVYRACIGIACILSAAVAAADSAWHAGAGIAVKHLRFDEIDQQDSRLVREQGLLPGLVLGGGFAGPRWDAQLAGAVYSGEIDYDGQTQSGQPLETDTDETFYELDLIARYRVLPQGRLPLSVYLLAGADTRLWKRRIQGTANASGLDEDYRWHRLSVGAACDYRTLATGTFGLQARILRTLKAQVDVHFDTGFDNARLNLKQRYGWRLEANWSGEISNRTELRVAGFVEQAEFGASASQTLTSNGTPIGTLYQPSTETRETVISARLVRHW